MIIPLKKLFEYDNFQITMNNLTVWIGWHDWMNKTNFTNKVMEVIEEFEEMPIEMKYNENGVELTYLIVGGINEKGIELY